VVAAQPKAFFTTPHFDGYAAVLIQLKLVKLQELREAIVDGWLACAPSATADAYLQRHRPKPIGPASEQGRDDAEP